MSKRFLVFLFMVLLCFQVSTRAAICNPTDIEKKIYKSTVIKKRVLAEYELAKKRMLIDYYDDNEFDLLSSQALKSVEIQVQNELKDLLCLKGLRVELNQDSQIILRAFSVKENEWYRVNEFFNFININNLKSLMESENIQSDVLATIQERDQNFLIEQLNYTFSYQNYERLYAIELEKNRKRWYLVTQNEFRKSVNDTINVISETVKLLAEMANTNFSEIKYTYKGTNFISGEYLNIVKLCTPDCREFKNGHLSIGRESFVNMLVMDMLVMSQK